MIELGRLALHWAGHIFGTNTGRLHLAFDDFVPEGEARNGTLRVSDDMFGASVFQVEVSTEGDDLLITGVPLDEIEGVEQGSIEARGQFDAKGILHGEWNSSIGTGGPFDLYPHIGTSIVTSTPKLEQIYTSNRDLGALRLYKADVEEIISIIRRKFPISRIVVSHIDRGAELALFDDEFEKRLSEFEKLDWIKFSVQAAAEGGFTKSLTIDMGQSFNRVTTQGPDEAWVLGEVEATASSLRRRQHGLSTAVGKYKVNFNLLILLAALVAMPELGIQNRIIFIVGVIVLILTGNKAADILVPNFSVDFQTDRPSWFSGILPSIFSWGISVTSAVAASFLFNWLNS